MRSREDITAAVEAHADTVLRACAVYLRERADQEDAFQETFLRYARSDMTFENEEHRKAWLIRVASNVCKDRLKSAAAHVESVEAYEEKEGEGLALVGDDGQEGQRALERQDVRMALGKLEERYRMPLYLKYYEGYTAAQIADALGIPENTVYTNLSRGKRLLKEVLEDE